VSADEVVHCSDSWLQVEEFGLDGRVRCRRCRYYFRRRDHKIGQLKTRVSVGQPDKFTLGQMMDDIP